MRSGVNRVVYGIPTNRLQQLNGNRDTWRQKRPKNPELDSRQYEKAKKSLYGFGHGFSKQVD